MLKINKTDIKSFLDAVSAKMSLFVPIKNGECTDFGLYRDGKEFDFDSLKTVKSAKDIFFPQSENLYFCSSPDGKLSITPEKLTEEPFVVFGIKGCDVRGLEVLDKVFMTDPVDSFYCARRQNGILISLSCKKPSASCFCTVFDVNPAMPDGDVCCTETANGFCFEPKTEKGKSFLEQFSSLFSECEDEEVWKARISITDILQKLPLKDLSLEGWNGNATEEKFNSPLWEKLYKPCLGCGTCTFVCPTCQCYDIKDYDTGSETVRYRCWDSCMYSDFTLMAAANSRTSQMQRYRQRFMHKLVYYPANYDGMYSCVGCGRCVDKCPMGLNIVKVIKAFENGGEKNV